MDENEAPEAAKGENHKSGQIPEKIIKRLSQVSANIPHGGFRTVEHVLDFAIAREKEAYDSYTQLAGLVNKANVRVMLEGFADDELRHAMRLDAVQAGEIKLSPEEIGSLGIAEKIGSQKITADMSYTDALVAAIVKEQNAFRLYTLMASKMHNKDVKAMFSRLAEEEAKHKLKLEIEYDLATF